MAWAFALEASAFRQGSNHRGLYDQIIQKEENRAAIEETKMGGAAEASSYVDQIESAVIKVLLSHAGRATSGSTSVIAADRDTEVFKRSKKTLQGKFVGLSDEEAQRLEQRIDHYQQMFSDLIIRPKNKADRELQAELTMATFEMLTTCASKLDNCNDAELAISDALSKQKDEKTVAELTKALLAVRIARDELMVWQQHLLSFVSDDTKRVLSDSRASPYEKKAAFSREAGLTAATTTALLTDPHLKNAMDSFQAIRLSMANLDPSLFTLPKATQKHTGMIGLINQTVATVKNVVEQSLQSIPYAEPDPDHLHAELDFRHQLLKLRGSLATYNKEVKADL